MSIAPPPTPSSSAAAPGAARREQSRKRIAPGIDLADHGIGGQLDAVELKPRRDARIRQPLGLGGQPGRALLDREQGDAVRIVRRTGGARGDDDQVGDMAVRDELLLAREPEAVARTLGLQRDAVAVLGASRRSPARPRSRRPGCPDTSAPPARCPSAPRPPRRRWKGRARGKGCGRSPPARSRHRHGRGPSPPSASPIRMPVKPISAKLFHRSREKPAASLSSRSLRMCDTGACSATKSRAVSRSIVCSSLR